MFDIIHVVVGLVILLIAGDLLVRGAVNLSLRLGIPALIVSLTVVAIGTSAPEMLVSIDAVTNGAPGLAIGNVVGSNISNVLLVLGVPAMIFGLDTSAGRPTGAFYQMALATVLFMVMAWFTPISWIDGAILVGVFAFILGQAIYAAVKEPGRLDEETLLDEADPQIHWWKIIGFLIAGLVGLPFGADLLVDGASSIARQFHVSETIIGLTLVAIGTSLPELATTLTAAMRRQTDVAIGNVLGSNIANLLAIIGVSSFFGQIPVSRGVLYFDMWVMAGTVLILAPFVFCKMNITRFWGTLFTVVYVIYVVLVLARRNFAG